MTMHNYTFHVSGIRCRACKIYIEDMLGEQPGVTNVIVDLASETIALETSSDENRHALAEVLTDALRQHGYSLSVEQRKKVKEDQGTLWHAIVIGSCFLLLFFAVQKSGILNVGLGGQMTPATSFVIGLLASVSSCLAIVGGLVLSLSAKISQDGESDTRKILLFHIGRLGSFALLGGVLGMIGGIIGFNFTLTTILGILASLTMMSLGLHLVGIFKRNRVVIPEVLFRFFGKAEHTTFAPLSLGLATFFLPCGFTQSMQVSALSSGSFVSGLSIMLSFALGTLPMLSLLSFGSASIARGKHAPLFFRSAGVIVIGLGLFAFLSGLTSLGIINPLFTL